jgi:lysophospholipase L1-like esterase
MKPRATFLFLISVFSLLLAGALYFPENGILLGNNLRLQFITKNDLFSGMGNGYANINPLLNHQQYLSDSVLTVLAQNDETGLKVRGASSDSLLKSITRIEYPDNDSSVLYPFFESLMNVRQTGNLIRIMHYGDSQIEDDRITSLLRNKLQNRFGGSGAGLVPVTQPYPYAFSMRQSNSANWTRFAGFGRRDTTIKHRRYGALASFCSYHSSVNSSMPDTVGAWVRFRSASTSYTNTRSFYQCRVFYSQNKQPFLNEIYQDGKRVDAEIFPSAKRLKVIRWNLDIPARDLTLTFKGKSSPEIYGIALDGRSGVAVDNIPMRGCSGLFFTSLDEQLMRDMYRELNVKLFILQFGGNFVPAGLPNFDGYERWFEKQLRLIRKLCPDAAILVMGVADMSEKDKTRYITNPNVIKVRDALRTAAFRNGAAFWDTYEAMGGQNSMPSWVFADPPLASADFVHFNLRGARTIGGMFYNAFILDYNRYENQVMLLRKNDMNASFPTADISF